MSGRGVEVFCRLFIYMYRGWRSNYQKGGWGRVS